MRIHTGIYKSTGGGATFTASFKQKINTKIYTEAKLVTIDDEMGHTLCNRHFLAVQGQQVHTTTIYKDYKSTILLAENGRTSSSKRTCHFNVQCFVTDKINKGEVKVAFCPSKNMIAIFFMKALQGSMFRKMCSTILNPPNNEKIDDVHRSL